MFLKKDNRQKNNKHMRISGIICRLFHKIETIETCLFVDKVSGKEVGKYRCSKCGKNI
jgi:peptide deformylase